MPIVNPRAVAGLIAVVGSIHARPSDKPFTFNSNTSGGLRKMQVTTDNYWMAPIKELDITCVGDSIKAGGDTGIETNCITAGQALCQDNDDGYFGRWVFGISEDNVVTLWDPKNDAKWEFCTDVTHICVSEQTSDDSDKYCDRKRPSLFFYNDKVQKHVFELPCDGTDGFDNQNQDKPAILKMNNNAGVVSSVGTVKYPTQIVKFKRGQTDDEKDDGALWALNADWDGFVRGSANQIGRLAIEEEYNSDKCEYDRTCLYCGETLTEDFMFMQDLVCDCPRGDAVEYAAVTVQGPAELDFNGYKVECTDNSYVDTDLGTVVYVTGKGAVLTDSTASSNLGPASPINVQGGNFGVVVGGDGGHEIQSLHVAQTGNDGIVVTSSFNKILNSAATDNGSGVDGDFNGDGIDLEPTGTFNLVQGNTVSYFGDDGIDNDGSHNTFIGNTIVNDITRNIATENSEDGVSTRGVYNKFIENSITGTKKDGFDIKYDEPDNEPTPEDVTGMCPGGSEDDYTGGYNLIVSNVVDGMEDGKGFKIRSDYNTIIRNTAQNTGGDNSGFNVDKGDCAKYDSEDGPGSGPLFVGGLYNYLGYNVATNNGGSGFDIESNSNTVVFNTANTNGQNSEDGEDGAGFFIGYKDANGSRKEYGSSNILAKNEAQDNLLIDAAVEIVDYFVDGDDSCDLNSFADNNGIVFMPNCTKGV